MSWGRINPRANRPWMGWVDQRASCPEGESSMGGASCHGASWPEGDLSWGRSDLRANRPSWGELSRGRVILRANSLAFFLTTFLCILQRQAYVDISVNRDLFGWYPQKLGRHLLLERDLWHSFVKMLSIIIRGSVATCTHYRPIL